MPPAAGRAAGHTAATGRKQSVLEAEQTGAEQHAHLLLRKAAPHGGLDCDGGRAPPRLLRCTRCLLLAKLRVPARGRGEGERGGGLGWGSSGAPGWASAGAGGGLDQLQWLLGLAGWYPDPDQSGAPASRRLRTAAGQLAFGSGDAAGACARRTGWWSRHACCTGQGRRDAAWGSVDEQARASKTQVRLRSNSWKLAPAGWTQP